MVASGWAGRLSAGLAMALILADAGGAAAYCRLTTGMPTPGTRCSEQGVPLEWHRQCISYSLVERQETVPAFSEISDAVDRSFQTWMAVRCDAESVALSVQQTQKHATCVEPEHNPKGHNANAIFFVNDWVAEGLPSQAFGLTLVWHDPDTGEIFDADMELNEDMGDFAVCDTRCAPGQVDVQNVVTHEAGHFLGLGHSNSQTASMFGESLVGETRKRMLNSDDKDGLCEIYGDLQPFECKQSHFEPRGGFARACYVPDEGCAVATTTPGGAVDAVWMLLAVLGLARRGLRSI